MRAGPHGRRHWARLLAGGLLAVCGLLAGPAAGSALAGKDDGEDVAQTQPNIVVITTDDQTLASFTPTTMPETWELFAKNGTTFTNAVATTPLCCPSRASFLTGQYGHNHGILANSPGYPSLVEKRNVLPTWLQRARYRTAHVGKWLHHYVDFTGDATEVAPGWDEWYTLTSPRYYSYELQVNGETESYGHGPKQHLTRVLNRTAVSVIKRWAPRSRPFYLQLDEFAPHSGKGDPGRCHRAAVPDPRDAFLYLDTPLPGSPSFNEQDVRDKPSFIRELPELTFEDAERTRIKYGCALAALRGVDRGVALIDKALRKVGERNNTAIIFSSDNGYFYGEHRLRNGKSSPYEEAIRLPMAMRLPPRLLDGAEQPESVSHPVANIDLAPTVLDLADGSPCRTLKRCRVMDGRSLVGLARGEPGDFPADREILLELNTGGAIPYKGPCLYAGIRYPDSVFVNYHQVRNSQGGCHPVDEFEYYELPEDPNQLENIAGPETVGPDTPTDEPSTPNTATAQQRERWKPFLDRIGELRRCSGIQGRDPPPESGVYCD